MNPELDNPRIKIRNSTTVKQCCMVCDEPIADIDEDGNVVPRRVLSISTNPGRSKIAFIKNVMAHLECAEALGNQIIFTAALENPQKILAYDVLPETD